MTNRVRPGPSHRQERARRNLVRSIGQEIVRLREDRGLPAAAVARAAGISPAQMSRIQYGETTASLPSLLAIAEALGSDLSIRFYPNGGPTIRDRFQSVIIEALIRMLHPAWRPTLEVAVRSPARGAIDLVLHQPDQRIVVAAEIHSQLRRLEEQLRRHAEKAGSLASAAVWPFFAAEGKPEVSRVLVLRSTEATRRLARTLPAVLAAAYPAPYADAIGALRAGSLWPGPTLLWAEATASAARILDRPPRGIVVGTERAPVR